MDRGRLPSFAPARIFSSQSRPAGHTQFVEDMGQMRFHGSRAYEQLLADLPVGETTRDQLAHRQLGWREALPTRRWALALASRS